MDRLRSIESFIKVADLGSFSAAAKAIGAPASSISRRIQDLEAELGATLLHRTTRVVRLTELGSLFLEQVRPAIMALDYAEALVTDQPSSPSGLLRMTASPSYGEFRLLPAVRKLRTRYPELVVDVELTDHLSDLSRDEVDIAVRMTAMPPERAIARKLTGNSFCLVASRSYLDAFGRPERLVDLADHRVLLYRGPGRVVFWQAKTSDGWVEVRSSPAFICNVGKELVAEACDGKGLALFPRWGIQDHLTTGTLEAITLEDANLALSRDDESGVYLLYHQPRYRLNKIRAAVDFLTAELTSA